MRKKLAIGICIAVPAIIGLLVSILCLFLEFYFDERHMEFIMANHNETAASVSAFLLPCLSGITFILTQFLTSTIFRKKNVLSQTEAVISMLIGVIAYTFLITIGIPNSLRLDFILKYMPRRELAPQIMALILIIVSWIFAFICGMIHLLALISMTIKKKREKNKKLAEE